ncbi:flagellar protein FlgN [Paenibacillus sp. RRE4]|uniref:Flagellar protein FlgN n=1 Tax=Paenibacillus cucumis (ex Kampfer et al. 2016) TaxID=1776858 RepID=A0ABS7KQ51_9BACL|nr:MULTISPECIES: flagellar protein FlgN [Paenibacillus]MBY0206051.1 flagellar protein FlgN [Paenibacillus cucumis (ex Kampfer et al. 2016)]MDT0126218.1 flagellar protein FlgN [Paenibacillus sp. RRE4]
MAALDRLIAVLEQMEQSHRDMLALSQVKREVIVKNDVDQLIAIMNKESKFMKQQEPLDTERLHAVHELLQERGIKSMLNLNVTEISKLIFDPADKQRLFEVQKKLAGTLQELKDINQLNQKLIEQSLMFIDLSMDMFASRPEQDATYQHPADKHGNPGRIGLFDTRA